MTKKDLFKIYNFHHFFKLKLKGVTFLIDHLDYKVKNEEKNLEVNLLIFGISNYREIE